MSHSYVSNLMHSTFSTKERYPFIDLQLESDLWPYIGGIARKKSDEGARDRWHGRSSSCAFVASFSDEFCEGRAVDQRRFFEMDTRQLSEI